MFEENRPWIIYMTKAKHMNFRNKWSLLLALSLTLLAGSAWSGATDIEYPPTTSAGHDFNHAPVGQTFVARAPWVKAGLYLADATSFTNWLATIYPGQILPGSYPYAVAPNISVNVKLLAGDGTTGSVLNSTDLSLSAPFMGFVDIDYSVLGVELRVGDTYTLLVSDISGQAYPNGVVGWVVPAVSDYSTRASLPPGAYPDGQPILQGTLITNDAGIGDNSFHVIDLYPNGTPKPPTTSCTLPNGATQAQGKGKITALGDGFIMLGKKKVNYLPCTSLSYKDYATSFAVGQRVEWQGYSANGELTASVIAAQ